jgi:hypothetical protein
MFASVGEPPWSRTRRLAPPSREGFPDVEALNFGANGSPAQG